MLSSARMLKTAVKITAILMYREELLLVYDNGAGSYFDALQMGNDTEKIFYVSILFRNLHM